MHRNSKTITILTLLTFAGCGERQVDFTMPARPVTVLELQERDFAREHRLTGSVGLYREEKIGFEVAGRVLAVLDAGLEVDGPAFDESGVMVKKGAVIATMEDTRYRLRVEGLQSRLKAAEQDLESEQAQVTLARQTLDRQKRILAQGAGRQQEVDNTQSEFDRVNALVKARRATVNAIDEELAAAQEDFDDTTLFAPFNGRVTEVHVSQGAVVEAGRPIVTLSLMDPVHVRIQVSADDERELRMGDLATVYPKDPLHQGERIPVNALVFEKDSVAHPDLRTFRIDLIVRNERRHVDQLDPGLKGLPVVQFLLPVVRRYQSEEGPLHVPVNSVYHENGETSVLRLPGVAMNPGGSRSAVGKHIPEKIPVVLGNEYYTVIKWNFRSLTESGDLREGDFLAIDPRQEHLDGLVIGRPQWLLRPGDLVPVSFRRTSPTGFYIPIKAISLADGEHVVFIAEDGIARAEPVTVHQTYRELRRIEGEGIRPGIQIIVEGVHYVSDGQPITITARTDRPEQP